MLWRSDLSSKTCQLQKCSGRVTSQKQCGLVSQCVFLIMIIFHFTETKISSKNAKQAQNCVNSFLQAFRFFQVCLQFLIFLVSKKQLKHDLSKKNQAWAAFCTGVLRLSLCAVTTSLWPEQKFKPNKSVRSGMKKRNMPRYQQVAEGI